MTPLPSSAPQEMTPPSGAGVEDKDTSIPIYASIAVIVVVFICSAIAWKVRVIRRRKAKRKQPDIEMGNLIGKWWQPDFLQRRSSKTKELNEASGPSKSMEDDLIPFALGGAPMGYNSKYPDRLIRSAVKKPAPVAQSANIAQKPVVSAPNVTVNRQSASSSKASQPAPVAFPAVSGRYGYWDFEDFTINAARDAMKTKGGWAGFDLPDDYDGKTKEILRNWILEQDAEKARAKAARRAKKKAHAEKKERRRRREERNWKKKPGSTHYGMLVPFPACPSNSGRRPPPGFFKRALDRVLSSDSPGAGMTYSESMNRPRRSQGQDRASRARNPK